MTEYPYGRRPNAFLNVKEAAKEPWRGITAWYAGDPHLVIDHDSKTGVYTLENEHGQQVETKVFENWEPSTEHHALVAASRLADSPFEKGATVGSFVVGNLSYFEKEWNSVIDTGGIAFPLERLVERYDVTRWDKNADLNPGMDYRCPNCGSHDITDVGQTPNVRGVGPMWRCQDCGTTAPQEYFEDEAPDADFPADQGFYENWNGASVKQADDDASLLEERHPDTGQVNQFDWQWHGEAGIHLGTSACLQEAGLSCTASIDPGISADYPEGLSVSLPGNPMDLMMAHIEYEMAGNDPNSVVVHVTTPDDPQQVKQILDYAADGARSLKDMKNSKVAEIEGEQNEPTIDTKKAVKCPNCGSHTVRAFSPLMDQATLVCLTCGTEFGKKVHMNPEASIKEGVGQLDPNIHAQILGLQQQINQAYQQGNQQLAQQLNQQLMQLLDNPSQPLVQQPQQVQPMHASLKESKYHYIRKEGDEWCIWQKSTGKTLSCHETEEKAQAAFRAMEQNMHSGNVEVLADGVEVLNEYKTDYKAGDRVETPFGYGTVSSDLGGGYHVNFDDGSSDGLSPDEMRLVINSKAKRKVGNSTLADTTGKFFLESMVFEADSIYDGGDDPYATQSIDLNEFQQEDPENLDDRNLDYAHCPACDGPGVLLGQLGNRIHYRCRNCGLDFSHKPGEDGSQNGDASGTIPPAPNAGTYPYEDETGYGSHLYESSLEDVKEVNQNTLRALNDSSGNPLIAGHYYTMNHPSYKVPDVVKILNLEDNRIEAAIESDEHGSFPIHITSDDAYTLSPYEKTASGWKYARADFSADEQDELINENPKGKARNFDKLKLDGTHYQVKEEATDPHFLLGW